MPVADPRAPSGSSVVDGEITATVRVVRACITLLVVGALVAGVVQAATVSSPGKEAVVSGLSMTAVVLAGILILLGSLVEGFGFGLSLGTNWPYTRNILVLLVRGDPEAAHRIVATLLGLLAVALVALDPNSLTISALALIVVTALFGVGTLHVLAGRLPSIVHGVHGLLAYGVFLCFLCMQYLPGVDFWAYLGHMGNLHCVLLAVFMGGVTTGQRGFGQPIGAFNVPRRLSQWAVLVHIASALAVVGTLGWEMPTYRVAFYLAVTQVLVGFLLFHAVELRPKAPGILVAFHQAMVISIVVAIVAVAS
ncbi:MAG: hypothetical protein LT070_04700 [Solirubrobacteraceae bacterium]|nr:hypothetical protein [Solirubrobacteraceae bacterium]